MAAGVREFLVSCRGCMTFETIWLKGEVLVPTRKFTQTEKGKVYHDCGLSDKPCQMFPRFKERRHKR